LEGYGARVPDQDCLEYILIADIGNRNEFTNAYFSRLVGTVSAVRTFTLAGKVPYPILVTWDGLPRGRPGNNFILLGTYHFCRTVGCLRKFLPLFSCPLRCPSGWLICSGLLTPGWMPLGPCVLSRPSSRQRACSW